MKCANLGIDEYPELHGSLWTRLKRGASAVTSQLISATKDSGVPGFSQAASLVRSAGELAEEQGWIPEELRTRGSSAPAKDNTALYIASAWWKGRLQTRRGNPAKDNTALYIGAAVVALLALGAFKKSKSN